MRDKERDFNGFLELSEAERDFIHSEILYRAGIKASIGIAVINHNRVEHYPNYSAWIGNYIRGFRNQLRISNLFELDIPTRKFSLDQARKQIPYACETFTDYFFEVVETCARNVAIMQAIGFTQDSLHYGQITLLGELTDLGVGTFIRPTEPGAVNTMHPWFRYERQPILVQNILYKTHAVKAEPIPVRLEKNARAILEQRTLFGAIRSVSPESANEIEILNPEYFFWRVYLDTYRRFQIKKFKRDVLSSLKESFNWHPNAIVYQIPKDLRKEVQAEYYKRLSSIEQYFEQQMGTWERMGPSSMHRQFLFEQAVQKYLPKLHLDYSMESLGFWERNVNFEYLHPESETENFEEDLSWIPKFQES